jgi:transcriptional regulator of acetoin/glycerol metabolism
VTRFVEALAIAHPARWTIIASWDRCARLSPHAAPAFHRVSDQELTDRLARASRLVEAALPRIRQLVREVPGGSAVAYVTDAQGIVLASVGDDARLKRWSLLPGYDWSEARMGTNGAGTCLVTGRPTVVAGNEHYITAFQDCTCTAVPIRGPDERIAGALDVSSPVGDPRGHRIAQVTAAALEIEAQLRQ